MAARIAAIGDRDWPAADSRVSRHEMRRFTGRYNNRGKRIEYGRSGGSEGDFLSGRRWRWEGRKEVGRFVLSNVKFHVGTQL